MKNLWFRNRDGVERLIATVENWNDVHRCIKAFIDQCNENKKLRSKEIYGDKYDESKVRLFESYYTRIWQQEDGRMILDVGSWDEFFLTDLPYERKN